MTEIHCIPLNNIKKLASEVRQPSYLSQIEFAPKPFSEYCKEMDENYRVTRDIII